MNNGRVAAVVVTFNRKNLLIECLDALLAQTQLPDGIVLINNASSDGTDEALEELGYLDNPIIHYTRMDSNVGGAGGFNEGIRVSHELGFDWAWVMDDDAEPLPDSLEKLSAYFEKGNTVAVCSVVADANGKLVTSSPHRGWFTRYEGKLIAKSVSAEDIAGKASIEIDHCSFVGLCFSLSAIDRIGLPKREMFIHYDDSEYCSRLKKLGKMHMVIGSVIKHKEAAKKIVETKKILGLSSQRIQFQFLWIKYFGYRNLVWMVSTGKIDSSRLSLLKAHIKLVVGVILFDDRKIARLRFWNSAFFDGLNGVFDNTKPRRILDAVS